MPAMTHASRVTTHGSTAVDIVITESIMTSLGPARVLLRTCALAKIQSEVICAVAMCELFIRFRFFAHITTDL